MIKQLDNPVWFALVSGNKNLGLGNDKAKYFQTGISPFAGVAEKTIENFQALFDITPDGQDPAIFVADKALNVTPWNVINRIEGYQMMYEGETPEIPACEIIKLGQENVPAMLDLTRLSPPGPFLKDTIKFGGYEGIFNGSELVAMAGHRFHCGPYVEISAVCTHPKYTGKGYARQLIHNQIRQLQNGGKIPFLHLRADNVRAYEIYKNLGFVTRTEMVIYILAK